MLSMPRRERSFGAVTLSATDTQLTSGTVGLRGGAGVGGLTVNSGKTATVVASGAANFNVTVDGPGSLVVISCSSQARAKAQ